LWQVYQLLYDNQENLQKIFIQPKNAIRNVDTKNYHWNPGTGNWDPQLSNSRTRPESDYEYNDLDRIIKYMNYTVTWTINSVFFMALPVIQPKFFPETVLLLIPDKRKHYPSIAT
jgi:hypothetical protein